MAITEAPFQAEYEMRLNTHVIKPTTADRDTPLQLQMYPRRIAPDSQKEAKRDDDGHDALGTAGSVFGSAAAARYWRCTGEEEEEEEEEKSE